MTFWFMATVIAPMGVLALELLLIPHWLRALPLWSAIAGGTLLPAWIAFLCFGRLLDTVRK